MLLIFLISFFFIFLISGFGLLVKRFVPGLFFYSSNWLDPFWIGFAILIGLLQLWHFVFPINALFLVVILFLSIIGWLLNRKNILKTPPLKVSLSLIGLLCILFVLVNQVIFSNPDYDHGLYHLQTVKWFNTYAVVPGLGNLHHRLAFNSAHYLYAAFLNSSVFQGYSYYVSSVILSGMLLLQSLVSLLRWITVPTKCSKRCVVEVILLPIILWHISTQSLAGYPADLSIFILQIVIFGKLLSLMEEGPGSTRTQTLFLQVVVLCAAASVIKLSFVPFGALVVLGLLVVLRSRSGRSSFVRVGLRPVLAAAAFWGLPWLARNAVMSGYLLYPSKIIKLPFQWTMPSFLINDIQSGISLWAKTIGGQLNYTADLPWFMAWLNRFNVEPRNILFFTFLLFMAVIILFLRKKTPLITLKPYFFLFPVTAVSLVMWFLSAPTYRFSGALIWLLFVTVFLMMYDGIVIHFSFKAAANAVFIVVLFLFFSLPNSFTKNFSFSKLVNLNTEPQLAQQQQPLETMVVRTTNSGLAVNLPAEGEPCWNLPLPCTTTNDFLPILSLRDPLDMGKGFYIKSDK